MFEIKFRIVMHHILLDRKVNAILLYYKDVFAAIPPIGTLCTLANNSWVCVEQIYMNSIKCTDNGLEPIIIVVHELARTETCFEIESEFNERLELLLHEGWQIEHRNDFK